jgi:hypothetical protein
MTREAARVVLYVVICGVDCVVSCKKKNHLFPLVLAVAEQLCCLRLPFDTLLIVVVVVLVVVVVPVVVVAVVVVVVVAVKFPY